MSDFWAHTVVLVTGASQNVGRAFAEHFASLLGADSLLLLASRSAERGQRLRDELVARKPALAVHALAWDFGQPDAAAYKRDLIDSCTHAAGVSPARFTRAVVVHNSAALGDVGIKVSQMDNPAALQDQINVNLVSMLVLNSVFLNVFGQANHRTVVNLTAPSAVTPRQCFGMTSLVKSSRQIMLSILAKEDPDVRVLHFDPVLVDTEGLRELRDHSHDAAIRQWIKGFYDNDQLLTAERVAAALGTILTADKFENGAVLDASTAV